MFSIVFSDEIGDCTGPWRFKFPAEEKGTMNKQDARLSIGFVQLGRDKTHVLLMQLPIAMQRR
jgi:hypothetical protein